MGRKRSARAPPPSTPSDAEKILPADAKVSSAPMPPDQRLGGSAETPRAAHPSMAGTSRP
eukprot:2430262-Prymnesium_polylepis.1